MGDEDTLGVGAALWGSAAGGDGGDPMTTRRQTVHASALATTMVTWVLAIFAGSPVAAAPAPALVFVS